MSDETPTRFDIVAYTGGKLRVDGFDEPVVVDLAGLTAEGAIPIAIKHDTSDEMILGQTDPNSIVNDGKTLTLAGDVTADPDLSPNVKRVFAMAKKGHKWQASIGAQIEEEHEVLAGESVEVNGQTLEGPFILATKAVIREASVLGVGADRHTSVRLSANCSINFKAAGCTNMAGETDTDVDAGLETESGFDAWVKDTLDMDPMAISPKAKQALLQQYAAANADKADPIDADGDAPDATVNAAADESDEDEGDDSAEEPPKKGKDMAAKPAKLVKADGDATTNLIAAQRKELAAEHRRVSTIQKKFGSDPQLCAAAIEKGWPVVEAENKFLKRQAQKQAPAGHSKSNSPGDTLQALQGAMILRAGAKIDHEGFGGEMGLALRLPAWLRAGINTDQRQKAMEAAWRFRDMSMVDLCRAAVQIDGNNSKLLDGSNLGFIRAAVSGGALADIFTTNINAVLIQKLLEAGDTTTGWTTEADAANFQTMDRIRLTKGPKLSRHARGGTADSATRSDIIESYKIARFSQIYKVDEMDIIDDRFQALKDIPDEMGLACARMRPDLVYSIIMANANLGATSQALFSATQPGTQSNLVASGGTLASATLQAGMAAMFNILEGTTGLNIYPSHILVPMVLAGLAFNLLQGQNIALAGTAGTVTERGDVNPLKSLQDKFGRIEVVTDQRLTNGVVDPNTGTSYSGSATTWRLVSNRAKTIEVAYLRGSGRAPQVRQFMLDQGQWGIGWDCNLDIGAKALEWRGFYEARA